MKKQLAVLTGFWLVFVLVCLGKQDILFSPAENRYLQQKPKFSVGTFLDGSFADETENWLSDQLPGRDNWVQGRTILARTMGRTENQGVYFGKQQYLLESFSSCDWELLSRNLETAVEFLETEEAKGAEGYLMLVPTAAGILMDRLPSAAPELNQQQLFLKLEDQAPQLIRVDDALREHREEAIYYRTDHHWTSLGAYYAYASFLEQTGRSPQLLSDYVQEILSTSFYGTNYARAGLYSIAPDIITAMYLPEIEEGRVSVDYGTGEPEHTLYDKSFLNKRDQYRVFLKGNYPLTVLRTGTENGKKLLLIKDSYANTFVQFLTSDYEEIHLVDLRYFRASLSEYAEEQQFTEVLFLYQIKNFAQEELRIF